MARDAAKIAATYFDAWKVNDCGVEDYMEGIQGMSRIKSDIVIRKVFVDDPDVLTWFDLHTTVASPVPVANWIHVEDGRITSLQVAFDARELAP